MKKFVSMLLALLMLIALLPMNAIAEETEDLVPVPARVVSKRTDGLKAEPATKSIKAGGSGTCGENLTWTLDGEGVLTISGEGAMEDYYHYDLDAEGVPAPWSDLHYESDEEDGEDVLQLDQFITSVIIENGVTSIGDYAFEYCSALTSVTLPNSVTSIGDYAFSDCSSLTSITLPNSVISIGGYAFKHCNSLTSITIPDSVKSIGDEAFSYCDELTEIIYGGTLAEWLQIGYSLPNGVTLTATDISGCRVGICGENLTWTLDGEGVLTISGEGEMYDYYHYDWEMEGDPAPWSDLHYASDEEDGEGVLQLDQFITSVIIENGVTSIGDYAFEYCAALTKISVPSSVTGIDTNIFVGCGSLSEIIYDGTTEEWFQFGCDAPENTKVITKDGTLVNMTGRCSWEITEEEGNYTLTITGPGSMGEYSSEQEVPWAKYREGITKVEFGAGVTNIGDYAFSDCDSLTSITIPDSVKSIGDKAFSYCDELTEIIYGATLAEWLQIGYSLPNGVTLTATDISGCRVGICGENLTWILDGEGVLTISGEGEMFDYYYDWEMMEGDPAPWSDLSYDEDDNIVPDRFIKSVVIENGVTSIGSYAFECCSALSSVTIPNSVTSIGYAAFRYCKSLTSITIPEDVTYIGSSVFYGCSSLKEITFDGTTEEWFQFGCDAPENTKVITKDGTLVNMTGRCSWEISGEEGDYTLTITGPGSMGEYSSEQEVPWAKYREGITKVEFAAGVTSIGGYAFSDCSSLTSITIPDSVKSIGYRAFYACDSLTSIEIPDSVKSIGNSAFEDCSSLISITLPEGLENIGYDAFGYCSALRDIYYGDSESAWEEHGFGMGTGVNSSVRIWFNNVLFENGNLYIAAIMENEPGYAWSEYSETATTIRILDGVERIPDGAFSDFSAVTYACIPNTVISIGDAAFDGCTSLHTIYFGGTEEEWAELGCTLPDGVVVYFRSFYGDDWYIIEGILTLTSEYSGYAEAVCEYCGGAGCIECVADYCEYCGGSGCIECVAGYCENCGGAGCEECEGSPCWNCGGSGCIECVADYCENCGGAGCEECEGSSCWNCGGEGCEECEGSSCEYCGGAGCEECEGSSCWNCGGEGCSVCRKNVSYVVPWANWADRVTAIVIEEGVDSLPHGAFADFVLVKEVVMPDSIEDIGMNAFSDCISLEAVRLSEGLTELPSGVFENCTSLQTLVLPESIVTIDAHAFSGCSALREINLPDNLYMAYTAGTANIEFSDGSRGFCLDSRLMPTKSGHLFARTTTTASVRDVITDRTVANEVKLLFTMHFDELFNVTEHMAEPKDAQLLADLVWHFTNGKEIPSEWQQKCDEIRSAVANGRVVPDYGYVLAVNETEEATFLFKALKTAYELEQNYLSYSIEIRSSMNNDADENTGDVVIDKYVADTTEYYETGVAQVELTAQGEPYNVPTDIVLVMDVSSSMKGRVDAYDYPEETILKIEAAKQAAKEFVTTVVKPGTSFNENRIAVVEFFDYAHVVQEMTHIRNQDELDDLTKKIQDMDYVVGGGTNYDDPLKVAGNILEAAKNEDGYGNRKQVVIFMTDGAPGIYNRACPFYFEVYGEFPEREDSAEKFVELRKDVALDISDYFWQTGSPLDTKYTKVLKSLMQEIDGEQYTLSITYCPGDSTLEGYDYYGTTFTNFLNSYWNKYVMGTLTESDFKGIDLAYQRVDAPEPIEADEPWEDGESKKYLLVADINEKPYVLSTVSSIDVDSLPTNTNGYSYYTTPNGSIVTLNEQNMTRLYPYFAPVTMSAAEGATEQYYISIDDAKFGASIDDYALTCVDATERTGIDGTFFLRAEKIGNCWSRWIRTQYGTPGFGVNSDMPGGLYYTEDGDLYNHNTNPWGEPAYFFYPNLNADSEYYLEITKTDPNVGYYFMEQVEVDMDMIPVELETHMADDNIFNKRLKGTATQEQLDTWGIEGEALNAQVYTVGFALNTNSTIDDPAGPGYLYFNSEQSFALLDQMASDGSALRADDMGGLYKAYSTIAEELVGVPIIATIRDTMGDAFDLQTAKTVNTENGTKEISVEPVVTFGYYELDDEGVRSGELHALETITFRGEGDNFEAVSDVLGEAVNCYDADAGMIAGKYIQYDVSSEEFMVEDIVLNANMEYVLNYWVHLSGSSEGTRNPGVYATNREATLTYTDKAGRDRVQIYPVPWLNWQSAITQIEYYLVNTNGEPINWENEVVAFEDRIIVETHAPFLFMLESTKLVNGCLYVPNDYEMYNPLAHYTVFAAANGTGRMVLKDTTETTYVVYPSIVNGNGETADLADYRNTRIAFAVTYSPDRLNMKILGAQAHVIHQHKAVDGVFQQEGLYTDGIRFGYEIDFRSMQATLEPNDYFNTGFLLVPMDRINATGSNTDYKTVRQMSLTVSQDGTYTANHGSPVFVGKLGENDSFGKLTLDADSMILWTEEMENASSARELCELLREQNQMKIFDVVGDSIRVMAYMKFTDETNRQSRADREIAFRAFFVTSSADGYETFHSEQFANSATRIFNDYNWRHFGVSNVPGATAEQLLQGASRLAPSEQ